MAPTRLRYVGYCRHDAERRFRGEGSLMAASLKKSGLVKLCLTYAGDNGELVVRVVILSQGELAALLADMDKDKAA
jgi:hypothetical protein